jgi:hypothetical protein
MPLAKKLPPLEYLNECFELRDEGLLFWKVRPREHFLTAHGCSITNGKFANKEAGTIHPYGYRIVVCRPYGNIKYHRIIYSMYHETALDVALQIDHINGNKLDNRPENLRLISQQENNRNASRFAHNTSGINGVHWFKRDCKWHAAITINKKNIYLGTFDTIEEAAVAREAANVKYGFSERHGKELVTNGVDRCTL